MTCNYVAVAIDQDRNDEAERLDAGGNLPNLLLAVPARIGGVGLYLVDTPIDQLQQLEASGARRSS